MQRHRSSSSEANYLSQKFIYLCTITQIRGKQQRSRLQTALLAVKELQTIESPLGIFLNRGVGEHNSLARSARAILTRSIGKLWKIATFVIVLILRRNSGLLIVN
jgi:hypothetical protein